MIGFISAELFVNFVSVGGVSIKDNKNVTIAKDTAIDSIGKGYDFVEDNSNIRRNI